MERQAGDDPRGPKALEIGAREAHGGDHLAPGRTPYKSTNRPDTVSELPSAENGASYMSLLKVQELGESNAAVAAVSRGNRFANSIRPFIALGAPCTLTTSASVQKPNASTLI